MVILHLFEKGGGFRVTQLLEEYRRQKAIRLEGNLYHKTQVELAYNSNRIEGSRLSADQTRQIFETRTVSGDARLDDIAETENHFKLFDLMLDTADEPLALELVRAFHRTLKQNTAQAASDAVFEPGAFKSLPNEVGGILTVAPEAVESELGALLASFDERAASLEDIVDFHWRFERIHPFQDGNGRVGRMLMFRSCLVAGVMPFIVADDRKLFYLRGLANYHEERGWLLDTCRSFQDRFERDFLSLVPRIDR